MADAYILEGKEAKPVSMMEWAQWCQNADRQVAFDEIRGCRVSTVFLGLDHGFMGEKPLIFETMIFGGVHDGYQERYSTWDEAEAGHKKACEMVVNS